MRLVELTDGRITVRSPTDDDAAEVAAAVQASLPSLRPWMPWATDDYDRDAALDWIRNVLEPAAVPLVIESESGAIVGSTGLNSIDEDNRRANLGYWLRPEATGNGYASAATGLAAAYGIRELGFQRIEIMMSVENEPSRRVAERSGAIYEGIQQRRLRYHDRQHDAHSFVFLADD